MAGTITPTHNKRGPIGVIEYTCTADASDGSYPETETAAKISGNLMALETNPGATAPTANYDIVLDDAQGHDVLEGTGANRHTTNTEKATIAFGTYHGSPVAITDVLTLKITNNSVNSAVVVIRLYYWGQGEG